jgi:hypothetical protein
VGTGGRATGSGGAAAAIDLGETLDRWAERCGPVWGRGAIV